jgi:hypothetical protein
MSRLSVPTQWQLPSLFVHRLGDTVGRQRAMTAEGHLLLVLHEPPVAGVPERTAGEIERAVELVHGDAKHGLDFLIAHQAEQQAARTYEMAVAAHRLNLLAALFFPVATLSAVYSAIFGMILAHGEQGWSTPALFWFLLGLGMVGGLVLARFIAHKPPPIVKPAVRAKAKRR